MKSLPEIRTGQRKLREYTIQQFLINDMNVRVLQAFLGYSPTGTRHDEDMEPADILIVWGGIWMLWLGLLESLLQSRKLELGIS